MARFGIQLSKEKAVLTLKRNYIRPQAMFTKIGFPIRVKQNSRSKDLYFIRSESVFMPL